MSVDALLARLAVPSAVPPVPSRFPGEGTREPFVNQGGSPGSLGSPGKVDSQAEIHDTRRLWLVTPPDGERFSLSFAPPMTRTEVEALHPGAVVEVEFDHLEPAPGPILEPADEGTVTPAAALVACRTCGHYVPNPRGFGGLGRCLTSAPASKRPGSLWPRGEIVCREHLEAAHDPE